MPPYLTAKLAIKIKMIHFFIENIVQRGENKHKKHDRYGFQENKCSISVCLSTPMIFFPSGV